jgi:hypothetical protein
MKLSPSARGQKLHAQHRKHKHSIPEEFNIKEFFGSYSGSWEAGMPLNKSIKKKKVKLSLYRAMEAHRV